MHDDRRYRGLFADAGGHFIREAIASVLAPSWKYLLSALCVGVMLSGCASNPPAPIVQRSSASSPIPPPRAERVTQVAPAQPIPAVHHVTKGDTLHAIAWRYRLDFRELARWNNIRDPNLIVVGQTLRLRAPTSVKRQASRAAPPVKSPTVALVQPQKPLGEKPQWTWPASGKVTAARSVSGSQGIQIRGERGQTIKAAAGGTVVYSGSGLRGYGELIIIKHNETFLSAYAHNEARLVEEGAQVRTGQTVARMGDTEAREVMLHFEIRRDGKTVDPMQFLPRR